MSDEGVMFWIGAGVALFLGSVFIPQASTNHKEWRWAEEVCAVNGGVVAVRPQSLVGYPAKAHCKNGARFTTTRSFAE